MANPLQPNRTPEFLALRSTQEFWDANPCGSHAKFHKQKKQRYAMEPWLPAVLQHIATSYRSLLEVGCGQGIDSTLFCAGMAPGSRYIGIDYSPNSVEVARHNAQLLKDKLAVVPEYQVGNAEAIDFPDDMFAAVYSMGVLRHTANEAKAIEEIRRVLEPGGKAYICLYRKFAPKVAAAKLLRLI